MSTVISVTNLNKSFAESPALNQINFTAEAAALVVIISPSGCGKSTLLHWLNGLELLDSGSVQTGAVRLALHNGAHPRDFQPNLRALLEKVGLGKRVDYYPAPLSGGQQKCAAIARARWRCRSTTLTWFFGRAVF